MSDEGVAIKRRIFLVDDHPLVREGLANLLNQEPDMEVCGSAADSAEAIAGIGQVRPALAVVDISLKTESGLDLIKVIRQNYPDVRVIVLSMHEESVYAERALRAGAKGYVMKRENSKLIAAAIRQVLDGGIYLGENLALSVAEKLARSVDAGSANVVNLLSVRELEIFRLLGQGTPTAQIAVMLNISAKTVQSYCARIKDKLHLSNATELLREAVCWYEEDRKG